MTSTHLFAWTSPTSTPLIHFLASSSIYFGKVCKTIPAKDISNSYAGDKTNWTYQFYATKTTEKSGSDGLDHKTMLQAWVWQR